MSKNKQTTLGAVAPNESGAHGILTMTGKYAVRDDVWKASPNSLAERMTGLKPGEENLSAVTGSDGQPTGTSIFDPVLCEICYKWFIPAGGSIIDPFAGGSVRGIVATVMGHDYTGIDLSARQIAANEEQAAIICQSKKPNWIVGDSRKLTELVGDARFDFIFACPPYYDLEVYSEDPADLSVCSFDEFKTAYELIIRSAVDRLKENRFAVYVIGDVRDKEGFYRGLPQLTIDCFGRAGMRLYNAAVLLTSVGSLPIRAGKQFCSGRKLGNTHQHVLVFFKGNPKKIKDEFPRLNIDGVAEEVEPVSEVVVDEPKAEVVPQVEPKKPKAEKVVLTSATAAPLAADDKWANWRPS